MSPLRRHLGDYLAIRRALGFKLVIPERLLGHFIDYLEERGEKTIRTEHAVAWASQPLGGHPSWLSARLSAVRGFATYLQAIDPACEVPAAELLPWRSCRAIPYLYSDRQIAALIEATKTLRTPHRAATHRTLIGLLAVTGMRIGEALRLDRGDVDLRAGSVLIRDTKFGKSRELPLHHSAVEALERYLKRPDRPSPAAGSDAVFLFGNGTRLSYRAALWTFTRLLDRAGIGSRSADCRPRPHEYADPLVMPTWPSDPALEAAISASRSA